MISVQGFQHPQGQEKGWKRAGLRIPGLFFENALYLWFQKKVLELQLQNSSVNMLYTLVIQTNQPVVFGGPSYSPLFLDSFFGAAFSPHRSVGPLTWGFVSKGHSKMAASRMSDVLVCFAYSECLLLGEMYRKPLLLYDGMQYGNFPGMGIKQLWNCLVLQKLGAGWEVEGFSDERGWVKMMELSEMSIWSSQLKCCNSEAKLFRLLTSFDGGDEH